MAKRTSLADIARRSGVSIAAVSLALRDAGRMAPKTRAKIKRNAATLGYYPNPLLAALASKRFGTEGRPGIPLAYIHFPEPDESEEITGQVLFGHLQEHARKLGYFLEQFKVHDFQDGKHATQVLFARGVQGIIVSSRFHPKMLPGMDWSRFFVVGFGARHVEKPDSRRDLFYHTAVDHFGLVLSAWNETWARGYRRIGFALFELNPNLLDDELRWAAAQLCLLRAPSDDRIPPFFFPIEFMEESAPDLRQWVKHHRLDAVIGFNTYVRGLLEHAGYRTPQDIGFVSLHKGTGVELIKRETDAGMREMRRECLLATVELLDQQIRHHQYGTDSQPRTVMIHAEWLDGETLPPKVPLPPHRAWPAEIRA